MIEVMVANQNHTKLILQASKIFWSSTPYEKIIPFKRAHTEKTIELLIEEGLICVAHEEESGEPSEFAGFCSMIIGPTLVNPEVLVATETALWVEPDHRGKGVGSSLVKFIEIAMRGIETVKILSFSSLAPFELDGFYENLGFLKQENTYSKVV